METIKRDVIENSGRFLKWLEEMQQRFDAMPAVMSTIASSQHGATDGILASFNSRLMRIECAIAEMREQLGTLSGQLPSVPPPSSARVDNDL